MMPRPTTPTLPFAIPNLRCPNNRTLYSRLRLHSSAMWPPCRHRSRLSLRRMIPYRRRDCRNNTTDQGRAHEHVSKLASAAAIAGLAALAASAALGAGADRAAAAVVRAGERSGRRGGRGLRQERLCGHRHHRRYRRRAAGGAARRRRAGAHARQRLFQGLHGGLARAGAQGGPAPRRSSNASQSSPA